MKAVLLCSVIGSVLFLVLFHDSAIRKRILGKRRTEKALSGSKTTTTAGNDKVSLRPIENPGNGDCLFWCFKQALHTRNQNFHILQLRAVVSESIDENTFLLLQSIFENAVQDNDFQLQKEFSYMQNTYSLQDLRSKIMLNTYWGDEFALVSLERFANVQAFVIKNGTLQSRPGVVQRENAILLNLCDEHYRLYMSSTGKAIFKTKPTTV